MFFRINIALFLHLYFLCILVTFRLETGQSFNVSPKFNNIRSNMSYDLWLLVIILDLIKICHLIGCASFRHRYLDNVFKKMIQKFPNKKSIFNSKVQSLSSVLDAKIMQEKIFFFTIPVARILFTSYLVLFRWSYETDKTVQ